MTRRHFCALVLAADFRLVVRKPVMIPVRVVVDGHAKLRPAQLQRFWSKLWTQTLGNFANGGVWIETTVASGEVKRSPGDRPILVGLDRNVLNVVVTDRIPQKWDQGRALPGVTTFYEGYYLSMIALNSAHGHQVPFVSVNTCVHEILHALLGDIFTDRPSGASGATSEFRDDWYATRLWLFHDGSHIREAALAYLERLRRDVNSRH